MLTRLITEGADIVKRRLILLCHRLCNTDARIEKLAQKDFAYPWLNALYEKLAREHTRLRPSYLWGVLQSSFLASELGVERISVLELGVAGGNGLLSMERCASVVGKQFPVEIDVYGFDAGCGLPLSKDPRDLPNLWPVGAYPMSEQKLRARLTRAELVIGNVAETIPEFLQRGASPIGFISFDLDHYTSTKAALALLNGAASTMLPRVYSYFDDILGFTYGHHNGERLAIREFNKESKERQISMIYGLRHYLPSRVAHQMWAEKMFMAHIMDHPRYGDPDGQVRRPAMDLV